MQKWTIDPDHSCAGFAVKHLTLASVRGQFNIKKGTILFDPVDRSRTSVEVELDVASVNSGIRKRDEHLLTADFFDQPKYPVITFSSSSVELFDDHRCRISGDLTIHGVTRPVTFEGEYAEPRGNPFGDELSIGFSGTTTINREDFGIMWGSKLMEGGGLVVGREVQLFLEVEADLAE
jgi:polyisoprenoid-binding protein YceI